MNFYFHHIIARHEAIPDWESGYASVSVEFGIASFLAMMSLKKSDNLCHHKSASANKHQVINAGIFLCR